MDGFADLDTRLASHECWCLPLEAGEFVRSHVIACINSLRQRYPQAKVILGAGAECIIEQLEAISGWKVLANSPEVVTQLDTPDIFFNALKKMQIPFPSLQSGAKPGSGNWLFKREKSCGGMGVSRESIEGATGYWQQEMSGTAVSVLCIADGQEFQLIGINEQYSTSVFDGYPYVYQGALANAKIDKLLTDKTDGYIDKIIKHFNLKGVFSIDMLWVDQHANGALYVLEINPRISASFELYERVNPELNLVDAHIRVCEGERLRDIEFNDSQSGYLIVYAKDDCQISPQLIWPEWVKDRPEACRQISKFEPICSVHADQIENESDLYLLLQKRANQVIDILNQQVI
ncbi:MAG: ATP-grasp domain-containing protein [Gammaproteobacteria bacterium]